MPLARDLMTPGAECLTEEATLDEAARRMAFLNVGSLPVCREDQHLTGIVTDRDIVVNCVASGLDPRRMKAKELLKAAPVTIDADDTIEHAITIMEKHRIRRLPVVRDGRLVGILSQADLARYYPPYRVGELIAAISA